MIENSQQAKAAAEQIDDRPGRARELVERCNNWARVDHFNLVESYVKGDIELNAGVCVEDAHYSVLLRSNLSTEELVFSDVSHAAEGKRKTSRDSNEA